MVEFDQRKINLRSYVRPLQVDYRNIQVWEADR